MTVLASAGPSCALQLVRRKVETPGGPRYAVRLLDDGAWLDLHVGRSYRDARECFVLEAHWRGWSARTQEAACA